MIVLVLGLVMFLGVHSTRIVADGWRTDLRKRVGEGSWKGVYSLVSLIGLVLIVYGYGISRTTVQRATAWPSSRWSCRQTFLAP
jgi:uncharacterized membrane protein